MTTKSPLSGAHLRTFEKLFQHPVSHNLPWLEVRALLAELGTVTEQANGHFLIARNGHSIVLHRPPSKDFSDVDDLMAIRHFVERSETPLASTAQGGQVVVVISHHGARIFASDAHGTPAVAVPSNEARNFDHAPDAKEFTGHKEKPSAGSLFEPLAEALKTARKILLFGSGTGQANEMDLFVAWLTKHHSDMAHRIVGTVVVDEHHLSDGELLAKAREFYARQPVTH
ncbi:MAG: hypothetical protein ABI222_08120 [Opitutaceae bacterium]